MKKLFIGLAVLLAIIIGAVVYVMGSLDSIIKTAVETYGSEITQADVSLREVKIEPTSGEGALSGLTVGNPKGFKSDSAFRLGKVSVALDIATVTEDTIVIREIIIDSPEITYELGRAATTFERSKRMWMTMPPSLQVKAGRKKWRPTNPVAAPSW